MLQPITIRYAFRPARRSLATGAVADLFGLPESEPPHTVADGLTLDVRPGDVVLFTGPSGSGKSSLLREVGRQLGAVDAFAAELPDVPLIDAIPGPVEGRLATLAGCGLGEARLLLRTPAELSDGQRYRFRLAYAMASVVSGHWKFGASPAVPATPSPASVEPVTPRSPVAGQITTGNWLLSDEFTAPLDRPLAKVVAFNLRKLAGRAGVGVLAATTHDDVADDLAPDLWVKCHGEGRVEAERRGRKRRRVSFADELWLSAGTRSDWAYFARWHYRGHGLGFVTRVTLLWYGREPVGVCVFGTPAASLSLRTRYFGLSNPRGGVALAALNGQLWVLQRVVLHPTYRGAGIAADFVRRACELCPVPWVETLAAMGHANPFFERAGFVRVGVIRKREGQGNGAFTRGTRADDARRRFSDPVYYVFDNRGAGRGEPPAPALL